MLLTFFSHLLLVIVVFVLFFSCPAVSARLTKALEPWFNLTFLLFLAAGGKQTVTLTGIILNSWLWTSCGHYMSSSIHYSIFLEDYLILFLTSSNPCPLFQLVTVLLTSLKSGNKRISTDVHYIYPFTCIRCHILFLLILDLGEH